MKEFMSIMGDYLARQEDDPNFDPRAEIYDLYEDLVNLYESNPLRIKPITQEQCERAVKELQESDFSASYLQGAPGDHGVWLDNVWDEQLQETLSFRIHDEEVKWWGTVSSLKRKDK